MRSGQPDISVIIPTRNRCGVLQRAVGSVLSQTHTSFELIVIDDASTDDTADYLATLTDPRIVTQRFDSWKGANSARNAGIEKSRAAMLTFLDSDDEYLPHRLSLTLESLAAQPSTGVMISSYDEVIGSEISECRNPDILLEQKDFHRFLAAYCLFISGSSLTVRKDACEAVGGFDVTMPRMQDREFLLRLARTHTCVCSSRSDFRKHQSDGSLSSGAEGKLAALGKLFRRHPEIGELNEGFFRYLVAREIISPMLQFKVRQSLASYREASMDPDLKVRLSTLLTDYLRGKHARRQIRSDLRKLANSARAMS